MASLVKFRDALLAILPRWLRGGPAPTRYDESHDKRAGVAYRLVTALGVLFDALGDAGVAAVKIRFPGVYSFESLGMIGRHRGIIRGPTESSESYSARCTDWLMAAGRAGGIYGTLLQLQSVFLPALVTVSVVQNDGVTWTLYADGTLVAIAPSVTVPTWDEWAATSTWDLPARLWDGFTWDWDGHDEYTSRFWVVVDNTDVGLVQGSRLWDDAGQWDTPPRLWDFEWNAMPEILRVVEESPLCRPPHAYCDCIIVVDDWDAWYLDLPDGDWDVPENRNLAAYYATGTMPGQI